MDRYAEENSRLVLKIQQSEVSRLVALKCLKKLSGAKAQKSETTWM